MLPGHAIHGAAINHLESTLGVHFPADYVQFASKFSGANNPDECTFEFSENDGSTRIGNFGAVLDAEGDDTESIIATVNNLDSQLPKNIIPVVSTGDGDYVCIDFRNKEHSTVVYFAHEKNYDDSIIPLAETFTDFLAILRLEPDDY